MSGGRRRDVDSLDSGLAAARMLARHSCKSANEYPNLATSSSGQDGMIAHAMRAAATPAAAKSACSYLKKE